MQAHSIKQKRLPLFPLAADSLWFIYYRTCMQTRNPSTFPGFHEQNEVDYRELFKIKKTNKECNSTHTIDMCRKGETSTWVFPN